MSRIEEALEKAASMRKAPLPPASVPLKPVETGGQAMERLLKAKPLPLENPCLNHQQKNPAASEEYRKLRSQILQLTKGQPLRNTLLVTSAGSREGKTVTALNLSMALAQEYDYTVLLVDADLRRPSVHEYLGLKPKTGLIQCLKGEATLEQALVKTGLGKFVVLPAGGSVSDPVELLSSKRMKELVMELKNRYPERYIVFDTPPSLPFADARVLSAAVDGVLFVIREGMTHLDQAREALAALEEAQLLGVVYNDASLTSPQSHYHYY